MKKCFKCNIEKPLDEFYKHPAMTDGHLGKCKECAKKDVAENYKKKMQNPEEIIKERIRTRLKFHRLYKGTSKPNLLNNFNYQNRHPERKTAVNKTSNAIRSGLLKKQPCEVCGELKVQAHHDDYSKPLEVRWLCIKHHNEYHIKQRESQLLRDFA